VELEMLLLPLSVENVGARTYGGRNGNWYVNFLRVSSGFDIDGRKIVLFWVPKEKIVWGLNERR
jgi:hypothetical protein